MLLFIFSGLLSHIKENVIFSIRSFVDFGGFGRNENAKLVLEVQFFYNSYLSHQCKFPMLPLFEKIFK